VCAQKAQLTLRFSSRFFCHSSNSSCSGFTKKNILYKIALIAVKEALPGLNQKSTTFVPSSSSLLLLLVLSSESLWRKRAKHLLIYFINKCQNMSCVFDSNTNPAPTLSQSTLNSFPTLVFRAAPQSTSFCQQVSY
jgi:prenyltransferase beta subunit